MCCTGVKDAVRLAGRGLFLLGVLTWMSSCLFPKLKSYLCPTATPPSVEGTTRLFFVMKSLTSDTDFRAYITWDVLESSS